MTNEYLLKVVVEFVETFYERHSISGKPTLTDMFIRASEVLEAIQSDPQLAHLHGWVDDLDARVDRATPQDYCPACGLEAGAFGRAKAEYETAVSHLSLRDAVKATANSKPQDCAGCGAALIPEALLLRDLAD